ncbi:hypothetical protein [Olsenella sp. kh2p3]|uniref:hypothetical protein n=1 Tax=Olsenella sp. kh2p3 TaxID=1797112 RepID=UPI00091691D7|nr:hypothetical protein [Olsenella sp. kh2p3]SFX00913.1 hypothetical protein SAMN04487823_101152 [Olsenella sp. kh2p3]
MARHGAHIFAIGDVITGASVLACPKMPELSLSQQLQQLSTHSWQLAGQACQHLQILSGRIVSAIS